MAPFSFSTYLSSFFHSPHLHSLRLLHSLPFTSKMASKENNPTTTILTRAGAAKRKSADVPLVDPLPNRKRVALAEISVNVVDPTSLKPCEDAMKKEKKKKSVKVRRRTPEEVVFVDDDDPQMCGPYVSSIFDYLYNMEKESKRRPVGDYMQSVQKDVSPNMRGILVDWLVELADEFKVVSDTLYLTISHIDRYLSKKCISRHKLQLLGITSMLIASKYEEIDPKSLEKFCDMTENTYTVKDVVAMEVDVLKALDYEMGNPTVKTFLRRFITVGQENNKDLDPQLKYLGCYLSELSLIDYGCVRFLPSMVAASAVFLARFTISPETNPWNSSLVTYTGYKASDLKECVVRIQDLQLNKRGATLMAVKNKYKQQKFKCVSTMSSLSEIPASYFEEGR